MSELGVERAATLLSLPESQEERKVHFGDDKRLLKEKKREVEVSCIRDPESESRPKRIRSASFSAPGESRHAVKRRKRFRVLPSKFLLGGNITDPLNLGSLEDRDESSKLGLIEVRQGTITKKSDAVRVIIPPNINDPLNLDVSSENEDSLSASVLRQIRRRRRSRKRRRRLSEPSGNGSDCEPLHEENFDECQLLEIATRPSSLPIPRLSSISPDALKPLTINTELSTALPLSDDQQDNNGGQITPVASKTLGSVSGCPGGGGGGGSGGGGGGGGGGGFPRPALKKQRSKVDNKIVSPVIPQPGVERKRHPSHSRQSLEKPHLSQQNLKPPKKFNPKNEHFQYGNYNKYYGYRNPDMSPDIRLDYLKADWFRGKEVLDVGCNIGHITLTIARDFNPKRVVGLDIDKKLVNIAQKNIKHYLKMGDIQESAFPKSLPLLYGPLKNSLTADGVRRFPHNIKFIHSNYVLESDELLETVRPEFDAIICFSITKWIHLNWGDAGLKRFFHRIFYNLHPGGRLILEPQGWPSYNKRRKLTKRIFENYKNIRLFPEKFNDYLLHEVGFSTSEKIITPQHTSRGFQRPIIVYTKADSTKATSHEAKYGKSMRTKQVLQHQQQQQQQNHHSQPEGKVEGPLISIATPSLEEEEKSEMKEANKDGIEKGNMEKVQKESEGDEIQKIDIDRIEKNSPSKELERRMTVEGRHDVPSSDGLSKENTKKKTNVCDTSVRDCVEKPNEGDRYIMSDNTCLELDNTIPRNSSNDKAEKHVTHSSNHKLEHCTSTQSPAPSLNLENHPTSEWSTKAGMDKTHTNLSTKSDNRVEGGCSKDENESFCKETKEFHLKKESTECSNTKREVRMNACEVSKDPVKTVNSLEQTTPPKPQSPPSVFTAKDRP